MNNLINVGLAVLVFGVAGMEVYKLGELNQKASEVETRSEMEAREAALKAAQTPPAPVAKPAEETKLTCNAEAAKKLGVTCNDDGTVDWSNLLAPIPGGGGGGGSGYVAGFDPYKIPGEAERVAKAGAPQIHVTLYGAPPSPFTPQVPYTYEIR